MTMAKSKAIAATNSVLADAEFVRHAAEPAFKKAANAAFAENDRLGITTYGAFGGKLVERQASSNI